MTEADINRAPSVDVERIAFLRAFNAFLSSLDISPVIKRHETAATLRAVRELAQLAGVDA